LQPWSGPSSVGKRRTVAEETQVLIPLLNSGGVLGMFLYLLYRDLISPRLNGGKSEPGNGSGKAGEIPVLRSEIKRIQQERLLENTAAHEFRQEVRESLKIVEKTLVKLTVTMEHFGPRLETLEETGHALDGEFREFRARHQAETGDK